MFYENQLFNLVVVVTWSFHSLIIGRIEKWHLLPSHCKYFNKTFIAMYLEMSFVSPVCFGSLLIVIGCNGNQNAKIMRKKVQKIYKKLSPQTPS